MAALERLTSAAGIKETTRMGSPLDPDQEVRGLGTRLEQMRARRPIGESRRPSRIDLDALWARWRRERPSLDGFSVRERRALCWDERAAGDAEFLASLMRAGHLPEKLPFLRGLWHSHQQHWRLTTAGSIEAHVGGALRRGGHLPKWLRTAATLPAVVGPAAPRQLSQLAATSWDVSSVLEPFGVTPDGKLGREVAATTLKTWIRELEQRAKREGCEPLLQAGHRSLLAATLVQRSEFNATVQALLHLVPSASHAFRAAVASFILSDERLGHPKRVATRGNWTGFSDRAIQTAVQLFAGRDLRAFFEILIGKNNDPQRRRPFWERYVESPQLVDFAIACDPADLKSLRARTDGQRATAARLTDAPENHSAFIMRFVGLHDLTMVEMSKANNALYVYRSELFEEHVGEMAKSAFRFRGLKDTSVVWKRLNHTSSYPGWQIRFDQAFTGWGIHPGKPA